MRTTWAALPILAALAACGDPLAGIERVSELPEPLPEANAAAALPDSAELDAQTPILAGLFRRKPPAPTPDPAITTALREANGLEPEPVSEPAAEPDLPVETVAAPPTTERRGVLGWLRRAADAQATTVATPAVAGEIAQAETPGLAVDQDKADDVLADVEIASLEDVTPEPEPQKRRGLFGLGGNRASSNGAPKPSKGPDARDVTLGTVLPFGEIARVCDAKPRDMGAIVARAARKGRGYVLYDSVPESAAARTFYVTGFADNCPRQFTAALALFGEPLLHEQLRYGLPARDLPYSATDEAYEKVKARVCNVGRAKPCGPRISRLEDTTTFVSVYENFGENARWNDILLHDGQVLAAALKTP